MNSIQTRMKLIVSVILIAVVATFMITSTIRTNAILDEDSDVVQLPEVYYYYRILHTSRQRSVNDETHKRLLLAAYEHHKEVYDRHFPNSILYVHQWHDAMNRIAELEKELTGIKQSRKYKLAQKLSNILHRKS